MFSTVAFLHARRNGLGMVRSIQSLYPSARCFATNTQTWTNKVYFSKDHEYLKLDGKIATIGISDYAAKALGDIVYVELPEVGSEVESKGVLSSVESVKAASDVYSPISGKIIEVNQILESEPGTINSSAFENGWIAKVELENEQELEELLSETQYQDYLKTCDDH